MATKKNQTWDRLGNLIADLEIEVSDLEIESNEATEKIRNALSNFRSWSNDARTLEELSAMTANQRLQRQAQLETRIAALCKAVVYLARLQLSD